MSTGVITSRLENRYYEQCRYRTNHRFSCTYYIIISTPTGTPDSGGQLARRCEEFCAARAQHGEQRCAGGRGLCQSAPRLAPRESGPASLSDQTGGEETFVNPFTYTRGQRKFVKLKII